MDRVAQLAEAADSQVKIEAAFVAAGYEPAQMRTFTRGILAAWADALGFPEKEISAAIDTALGGR